MPLIFDCMSNLALNFFQSSRGPNVSIVTYLNLSCQRKHQMEKHDINNAIVTSIVCVFCLCDTFAHGFLSLSTLNSLSIIHPSISSPFFFLFFFLWLGVWDFLCFRNCFKCFTFDGSKGKTRIFSNKENKCLVGKCRKMGESEI